MDFVTDFPISTDWKGNSYDLIVVIVHRLTKMVHYELVKVTIYAPRLGKMILDVVVRHYGLPDLIVSDRGPSLHQSSRHHYAISGESSKGSPILRQITK